MSGFNDLLTPELMAMIYGIIIALGSLALKWLNDLLKKSDETQKVAIQNQEAIRIMDNAQTAQMVAQNNGQALQAVSLIRSTYRKMSDSVKSDTCNDISLADQRSFLQQVAFNEEAGNERYTVSLSKGFLIVDNGMIADDSMPPMKEG